MTSPVVLPAATPTRHPAASSTLGHGVRGALGMVCVGSSVAVSATLVGAPLLTAQAVRYALAAALLLLLARARGVVVSRPRGAEWAWLAGVAGSGLVLFNIAIVRGVEHAEPAAIAVAVASAPVLIALLGPALEGRLPQPRIVAAASVVTLGAVVVEGTGRAEPEGVAWAVVALLCEAGFTLLAVPVLARHSPWGVSIHSVWIAAVALGVGGVVLEGPTAVTRLDTGDLLALLHLAVVVTAAAFVLWYGAVAGLGAARAALLCGVAPVSAALLGIATTGRVPGPGVWGGIAVVLAGLGYGFSGRPRQPTAIAAAPSAPGRATSDCTSRVTGSRP